MSLPQKKGTDEGIISNILKALLLRNKRRIHKADK